MKLKWCKLFCLVRFIMQFEISPNGLQKRCYNGVLLVINQSIILNRLGSLNF